MKYEIIPPDTWDRKVKLDYYKDFDMPYIIMTAEVDVTNVVHFAHKNEVSFNLCMVYLCNEVADSILHFRYRMIDGKPCLVAYNQPEINHIFPGEEEFVMSYGAWPNDSIIRFCRETYQRFEDAAAGRAPESRYADHTGVINYTAIPWVHYSQMFRTIKKGGGDTNPKISFGKYMEKDGHYMMPVSVQVHHTLMDGYHVGQFYIKLEQSIQELAINPRT